MSNEYKFVPVVPTESMLAAGAGFVLDGGAGLPDSEYYLGIYTAMLAASPAHDGEVVAVVESNDNGDKWAELTDGHDGCGKHLSDGTKLYAHTAPPRVVDEAMIERGLQAAASASDARLARYSVVIEILKAALEEK